MISKVQETNIESRVQESGKKEKDRGPNRGSESVEMALGLWPQAGNCSGGLVLPVIKAGEQVLNSGFEPVRMTGGSNCLLPCMLYNK